MLRVFVRSGYGYLPLSCAAHARTLVVAEGDYRRRLPDHLRRNPRAIRIAYPESGAFIASQHELVSDMLHVAAIEKSEGLNTDQTSPGDRKTISCFENHPLTQSLLGLAKLRGSAFWALAQIGKQQCADGG